MNMEIKYLEGAPDWLDYEDAFYIAHGDVYVVCVSSKYKRGDLVATSKDSTSLGLFLESKDYEGNKVQALVELQFDNCQKYSALLWEYRWEITVVLVPVWDILSNGDPIQISKKSTEDLVDGWF